MAAAADDLAAELAADSPPAPSQLRALLQREGDDVRAADGAILMLCRGALASDDALGYLSELRIALAAWARQPGSRCAPSG